MWVICSSPSGFLTVPIIRILSKLELKRKEKPGWVLASTEPMSGDRKNHYAAGSEIQNLPGLLQDVVKSTHYWVAGTGYQRPPDA